MSPSNETTRAPSESIGTAGTARRVVRRTTVHSLVLAALVVLGLAGTGASSGVALPDDGPGQQPAAVVSVDCTGYRIDVPADTRYYLHVHVVDEATGERFRAIGGPFTGPATERTTGTDLTVTAIEVLYAHGGGTSASRPEGC